MRIDHSPKPPPTRAELKELTRSARRWAAYQLRAIRAAEGTTKKAKKAIVFGVCLLLCSCASYPTTKVQGAGTVVVGEDPSGLYFNDDGHKLWLYENVSADFFTPVAPPKQFALGIGTWHINDVWWQKGQEIRTRARNPAVALPAPVPALPGKVKTK